jgi:hypothetical protein
MKKIVRLTESDLTKLVKRVIKEDEKQETPRKKIYTVVRYQSNGEIDWNDTESFFEFSDAERYRYELDGDWGTSNIDIIPNMLQ